MNVLVESVAGSRLYGTHRVDSDTDVRGVCLAPIDSLIGLAPAFEQVIEMAPIDRTVWELRKFVHLALANNPNILDVLFCPPDKWLYASSAWAHLYELRTSVLSQQVRKTYAGYATSQLKRIEGHRKWLINPPEKPDENNYGCYEGSTWEWFFDDSYTEYKALHKEWTNYTAWLNGRNPERHALEVKYGYDTKHASHLMRLLIQGRTILEEGDFSPVLTGPQLSIVKMVLNGEWSYDYLMEQAEWFFDVIAHTASTLPEKPDSSALADVVLWIYMKHIRSTQ